MAIVDLGWTTAKNSFTASASTLAVTVPAGGAAIGAKVLVVACTNGVVSAPATCADARGNTYVADVDFGVSVNGNTHYYVFRSDLTTALVAGDAITITITTAVLRCSMQAQAFTGLASGAATVSSAQGSGTGVTNPTLTGMTATSSIGGSWLKFTPFGFNLKTGLTHTFTSTGETARAGQETGVTTVDKSADVSVLIGSGSVTFDSTGMSATNVVGWLGIILGWNDVAAAAALRSRNVVVRRTWAGR